MAYLKGFYARQGWKSPDNFDRPVRCALALIPASFAAAGIWVILSWWPLRRARTDIYGIDAEFIAIFNAIFEAGFAATTFFTGLAATIQLLRSRQQAATLLLVSGACLEVALTWMAALAVRELVAALMLGGFFLTLSLFREDT